MLAVKKVSWQQQEGCGNILQVGWNANKKDCHFTAAFLFYVCAIFYKWIASP